MKIEVTQRWLDDVLEKHFVSILSKTLDNMRDDIEAGDIVETIRGGKLKKGTTAEVVSITQNIVGLEDIAVIRLSNGDEGTVYLRNIKKKVSVQEAKDLLEGDRQDNLRADSSEVLNVLVGYLTEGAKDDYIV